MAILSKGCKPDNFESHNSLKLSFTNIQGLCSNFVDSESSLKSNSLDILALCETNLNDSTDSGNFSLIQNPLIQTIPLFICMILLLMWTEDFLLHKTYL